MIFRNNCVYDSDKELLWNCKTAESVELEDTGKRAFIYFSNSVLTVEGNEAKTLYNTLINNLLGIPTSDEVLTDFICYEEVYE